MFLNRGILVLKNSFQHANYAKSFSISSQLLAKDNYKLVIVGGGTGGITMSAKFNKILGANNVAVVDPNEWHCKINK